MTDVPHPPDFAVAVTSIGRPALRSLLDGLAASTVLPVAVAVADQSSGSVVDLDAGAFPYPLIVVPSSGGASRGRNDAVAALDGAGDVLGFPNDDSRYGPDLVRSIQRAVQEDPAVAAVVTRLDESTGPRFLLPPVGTELTRRTVWRAIEPATFVSRKAFEQVGGFATHLGTGAAGDWGSGEGTDLLLRIMASGGRVVSRSDLAVLGTGERRELHEDDFVAKHRSYARGTGYLYRVHAYPMSARLRTLAGPAVGLARRQDRLGLSLRVAAARTVGRLEGLTGRSLERRRLGTRLGP